MSDSVMKMIWQRWCQTLQMNQTKTDYSSSSSVCRLVSGESIFEVKFVVLWTCPSSGLQLLFAQQQKAELLDVDNL